MVVVDACAAPTGRTPAAMRKMPEMSANDRALLMLIAPISRVTFRIGREDSGYEFFSSQSVIRRAADVVDL